MCTLEDVVNQLKEEYPGLVHMKIPTCNSAAPSEADFDIIRFNIDFNSFPLRKVLKNIGKF